MNADMETDNGRYEFKGLDEPIPSVVTIRTHFGPQCQCPKCQLLDSCWRILSMTALIYAAITIPARLILWVCG